MAYTSSAYPSSTAAPSSPPPMTALTVSTSPGCRAAASERMKIDVPWQKKMQLGLGYDSKSGQVLSHSALSKKATVGAGHGTREHEVSKAVEGGIIEYQFDHVRNRKDLEKFVDGIPFDELIGGAESLMLFTDSVKGLANLLSEVSYGDTHMTTIIRCSKTLPRRYLDHPSLSSEAAELLKNGSLDEFRRRFGDYFIAGSTPERRQTSTLKFTAQSKEDLDIFKHKLGIFLLDRGNPVRMEQLDKLIEGKIIAVEAKQVAMGVHAAWPSKGFHSLLSGSIFPEDCDPVDAIASLQHYSTVDERFPLDLHAHAKAPEEFIAARREIFKYDQMLRNSKLKKSKEIRSDIQSAGLKLEDVSPSSKSYEGAFKNWKKDFMHIQREADALLLGEELLHAPYDHLLFRGKWIQADDQHSWSYGPRLEPKDEQRLKELVDMPEYFSVQRGSWNGTSVLFISGTKRLIISRPGYKIARFQIISGEHNTRRAWWRVTGASEDCIKLEFNTGIYYCDWHYRVDYVSKENFKLSDQS
ncbi:hypothetical protein IE53DRAFT_366281 [Violaceomyces palustris]|uniref:Uncharacterized protein n=1 Tax=Violaceomyces palustris TaxID=1673888 RepID=A0ACD0P613_9BASI|nr:hypothetical protein IE53DRAFT_366281 [Violaceomyces palustris]